MRLRVAEVVEHHGAGPDLPNWVGDALAEDVWRGAMHRLEERREIALRIDIARGRDRDGARAGRAFFRSFSINGILGQT